ncbi:KGGVGR-motif variant AAA ATPase [Rhizobium leguminosarum]|uniref:KGGVGR-motif variant AAA ATPase n=1 Tax=Rhizobium TaxID=379 RepID=UPI001C9672D8|nr:AAA family ATPase [Rhizobium leguminosarum]MBY5391025.1 ParA family protein [Rhizobium leguminosarum]
MTVKFQESLPVLLSVAKGNGIPLDGQTTFVRDGAGRLLIARKEVPNRTDLEAAIRNALGEYASPVAVVDGVAAERLSIDPSCRIISVLVEGDQVSLRYIDRRFVGADWMSPPASEFVGTKRLVFGSLKGGVGRSTALAIFAADLARDGKKVLCIDLDLEAPGIGTMLLPPSDDLALDRRPKYGVIDYLIENGLNGILDEELYDFVGVSPFYEGSIDVVPATGRETDREPKSMIAKLSRALIEDVKLGNSVSLTKQVRAMVDRLATRTNYDVVLIDARAGMAEITAATLLGLGAELLFFGTHQSQTFRGYSYILAHLASLADHDSGVNWKERITFVQAKAPSSTSKREPFRESLYELCAAHLYDADRIGPDGITVSGTFSPSIGDVGPGVPHDATFIQYHPDYDAFDPVGDKTQLDAEVYNGPFGSFLRRAWETAGIDRNFS